MLLWKGTAVGWHEFWCYTDKCLKQLTLEYHGKLFPKQFLYEKRPGRQTANICRFMCSIHGFWHKVWGVLAFFVVEQVSDNTRQQEQNVFWTNLLFQNTAGKMLTYQHVPLVQKTAESNPEPPFAYSAACAPWVLQQKLLLPGCWLSAGAVDTTTTCTSQPWVPAGVLLLHPAGLLAKTVAEVGGIEEV